MRNQKYRPLPLAVILLDPVAVITAAHRLDPLHVVQIPVYSLSQCLLEPVPRSPAQLFAYLGCIDRVAPVMPRPVSDKLDQMFAGILARTIESLVHEFCTAFGQRRCSPVRHYRRCCKFARGCLSREPS